MNTSNSWSRWARGISLAVLFTTAAGCSVDDPEQTPPAVMRPPSQLAVHVSLGSDGTAGIVSATLTSRVAQPTPTHSDEILTYTFRSTGGTMLANGTVDDPRPVHAEFFDDNGNATRAEAVQPFASIMLQLPARRGILEFTDANGISVAHVEVSPPTDAAPPGSVVQQLISPSTDVIGSPVKVVDNGSADDAYDLLFLPEGYTQAELPRFHQDVDRVVRELFARPDYARHAHRFNVWRIDVRSANSGVSPAAPAALIDTAFAIRRAAPDGQPLQRLFLAGDNRGMAAATELGARVRADHIFILANTTYGGAGGEIGVASNDASLPNVVAHELGHSILHLADEYFDATYPERSASECTHTHTTAPNMSETSDRASLPWRDMVLVSTPVPSTDLTSNAVGAYLGGDRCANARWRPTPHCLMNSNLHDVFCPVCQAAMDRYFAQFRGSDGATGTTDPGTGTAGTDPGTSADAGSSMTAGGSDPGSMTGTGTAGSDAGTGSDPSATPGSGSSTGTTPTCTNYCSAYGYAPGQCVSGWYCDGTCIVFNGCDDGSSAGSGSSDASGSSDSSGSGSSDPSAGTGTGSDGSGSSSACMWTCEEYGYTAGQCVSGYYCDGTCIVINGCT
jgi:hypothetical protein